MITLKTAKTNKMVQLEKCGFFSFSPNKWDLIRNSIIQKEQSKSNKTAHKCQTKLGFKVFYYLNLGYLGPK